MPSLTRRRDPNSSEEAWRIFYGDVRVGRIGKRSGNPVGTDAWSWQCGFYPGSNPGDESHGTEPSFDAARAAFESARSVFLSKRTEADFRLALRRGSGSTVNVMSACSLDGGPQPASGTFHKSVPAVFAQQYRTALQRFGPSPLTQMVVNDGLPSTFTEAMRKLQPAGSDRWFFDLMQ
jgi:hypothetical protein